MDVLFLQVVVALFGKWRYILDDAEKHCHPAAEVYAVYIRPSAEQLRLAALALPVV